jgi:hypothetical protein
MRVAVALVCLFAVSACDEHTVTGPAVPLNEQFQLAPGEVAAFEETSARLQFVEVTGDSRCPADAVCIQGGDAIVHVRVVDRRGVSGYELHTGDARLASASHRDLRITLVQLEPYPFSSHPIDPSEYRATLLVTR